MEKIRTTIVLVCCTFILTGCGQYTSKVTPVTATVTQKSHINYFGYYMPVNNSYIWVSHPEQNNVTISYELISKTFDSEELYNTVEVGDEVEAFLWERLNEDGLVCERDLKLELE